MDLPLNNLQWLICHKTKQNQTKPKPEIYFYLDPLIFLTFMIITFLKCLLGYVFTQPLHHGQDGTQGQFSILL